MNQAMSISQLKSNKNTASTVKIQRRKAGCFVAVALAVVALMSPASVLAAEEDYLDELSAEANDTARQTKRANSLSSESQKQFKDMETLLARERPTTFKFYEKLSSDNKEKVLKVHQSENKLSITSKTIMDLYFSN